MNRLATLAVAVAALIPATPTHAAPLAGVLDESATANAPGLRIDPPAPRTIEQIIRDVWPDELEARALRIAWRESNWNCCVRTYCCFGVFQIYFNVHKGWLDEFAVYTAYDLYDPVKNVTAAYHLYEMDGWSPWAT